MNIRVLLNERVRTAMDAVGLPQDCPTALTQSTRPEFGDYQANGAMGAAKLMKVNPRELASRILAALDLGDMAANIEIAGPGFINIQLDKRWMADQFKARAADPRLGVPAGSGETVVVDYSAPNLAKEMHVGHLRSTIIGDAVVRVLEFREDTVIRQNHVGDWGTQFGMLIAQLEDQVNAGVDLQQVALADIEEFYRGAKQRFDSDVRFAGRARDYVVRLQSGDAHCNALWQQFIEISFSHCEEIYRLLNVSLTPTDMMPESAYSDDLPGVLVLLRERGLLAESDGAQVVFLEELRDREGNPMAVIVQKRDGGFLYSTTDLAAVRHRGQRLNAQRVLYFIDDRQRLHMQQIFAISRLAGLIDETVSLEHHPFGKMLGLDGKPFKTRAGGTIKLVDLIHEAIERAAALLANRDSDLNSAERADVARKIGIGAIKYADLSKHRSSDYVFNWEQMLSFEGNTAPYLQYAYTRIRSIFRRAGIEAETINAGVSPDSDDERAVALKLLQFPEAIDSVVVDALPHLLCAYLYELSGLFMGFYERCPVLHPDVDTATRGARLSLCWHTAETLRTGLDLLGIEVMERM